MKNSLGKLVFNLLACHLKKGFISRRSEYAQYVVFFEKRKNLSDADKHYYLKCRARMRLIDDLRAILGI